MTYTLYLDIPRHLTWDDNTIASGMLEEVLPLVASFHDVKPKDINVVLDFYQRLFGHVLIVIESDNYIGSYCIGKFIAEVLYEETNIRIQI